MKQISRGIPVLNTLPALVLYFGLAVLASTAHAVDGVCLISQNTTTGVVSTCNGPASFPLVLATPGSYRLASNLTLNSSDPNAEAIGVAADNVTLDLNGFSLSCTSASCSGQTSGQIGIAIGFNRRLTALLNGSVTGFSECVSQPTFDSTLVTEASIDGIRISGCGVGLLLVGASIRNSTFTGNNQAIMLFGGGSSITGNVITQNQVGLFTQNSSISLIENVFANAMSDVTLFSGNILSGSNLFAGAGITNLNLAQGGFVVSQNNNICGVVSC